MSKINTKNVIDLTDEQFRRALIKQCYRMLHKKVSRRIAENKPLPETMQVDIQEASGCFKVSMKVNVEFILPDDAIAIPNVQKDIVNISENTKYIQKLDENYIKLTCRCPDCDVRFEAPALRKVSPDMFTAVQCPNCEKKDMNIVLQSNL